MNMIIKFASAWHILLFIGYSASADTREIRERVNVPARIPDGIELQTRFHRGVTYEISISGDYQYDVGEPGDRADAEFREDDESEWTIPWASIRFDRHPMTPVVAGFNPSHDYLYRFLGDAVGHRLNLSIYDGPGTYGDNAGFLSATVFVILQDTDLNDDGVVDAGDANRLFQNWGGSGEGDFNADGTIDVADAGQLFSNWTGDNNVVVSVPEPLINMVVPSLLMASIWRRRQSRNP